MIAVEEALKIANEMRKKIDEEKALIKMEDLKHLDPAIDKVYQAIEKSATNGDYSVEMQYIYGSTEHKIVEEISNHFKELGYDCKINTMARFMMYTFSTVKEAWGVTLTIRWLSVPVKKEIDEPTFWQRLNPIFVYYRFFRGIEANKKK